MEGTYGKGVQRSGAESIITQVSREDGHAQVQYEEEDKSVGTFQKQIPFGYRLSFSPSSIRFYISPQHIVIVTLDNDSLFYHRSGAASAERKESMAEAMLLLLWPQCSSCHSGWLFSYGEWPSSPSPSSSLLEVLFCNAGIIIRIIILCCNSCFFCRGSLKRCPSPVRPMEMVFHSYRPVLPILRVGGALSSILTRHWCIVPSRFESIPP